MAWYKTGSVSVILASTVITAKDTRFASNVRVGDGFRGPDGEWYEIVNIASETVLGIYPAYQGATENDSANYMVAPLQGYNKESADRLRAITDSLRDITGEVEEAKQSAAQAKASELAAKASETSAGQSKDAAKISEDAAKASELAAKNSETSASSSEQSATASAGSATQSASDANASKVAAKASQDAAKVSETNSKSSEQASKASEVASKTSETNSKTSETNAAGSASSASTDATTASDAAGDANVAKVAAEKARDEAVAASGVVTGSLTDLGPVDLSSGQYPPKPVSSSFWKVVVGGDVTVGSETIDYGVGDTLIYSKIIDEFYKIDNTESVSSVNGKTGVVVVDKTDVGLPNVNNTSDAAKPISTATQTALDSKVTRGSAGLDSDTAPVVADANLVTKGGFHALVAGSLNHAGSDNMSLMHISHSPNNWSQVAIGQGAGSGIFVRSKNQVAGTPGPWTRVVKVFDYGIGANGNATWAGNNINPDGMKTQGEYPGQYNIAGFWTMSGNLTVTAGTDANGCTQSFTQWDSGITYRRTLSGTWRPWLQVLRTGDFGVGAVRLDACNDANTVASNGVLLVHPGTTNSPGVYGTIDTKFYEKSSGNWTQLIQSTTGEGNYFRSSVNGAIGDWNRIATAAEGYAGTMVRSPAGTNASVLPNRTHRRWLDGASYGTPVDGFDWLIEHTFITTGYAWQQAQSLNPEYPGVYTRSQNNGVWSAWIAPTSSWTSDWRTLQAAATTTFAHGHGARRPKSYQWEMRLKTALHGWPAGTELTVDMSPLNSGAQSGGSFFNFTSGQVQFICNNSANACPITSSTGPAQWVLWASCDLRVHIIF